MPLTSIILRHSLRQNRRIRQPLHRKRPLPYRPQKRRKIPHRLIRHTLHLRNQNLSPLGPTRLTARHLPLCLHPRAAVHRLRRRRGDFDQV